MTKTKFGEKVYDTQSNKEVTIVEFDDGGERTVKVADNKNSWWRKPEELISLEETHDTVRRKEVIDLIRSKETGQNAEAGGILANLIKEINEL